MAARAPGTEPRWSTTAHLSALRRERTFYLGRRTLQHRILHFFSESDLQNLGWVKYYNFETQCLPSFDANRNKRRPLSGLLLRDCCQGVQCPLASGSRRPARACQRQRRPCQPPLGPEGWHDLRVNSAAPAVMSSVSGPVTGTASNTP